MKSKLALILTCLLSLNSLAQVSVGNTILSEREVIGNLNIPWEIKWGYDDHIWMTERPGIVSRVNVETGTKQVLLDIQSLVFSDDWSEAGLLGMEFHPDFETNHILFLTYTFIEASSVKERLVAYTYNEAAQSLENEQILIDNINGYTTHTIMECRGNYAKIIIFCTWPYVVTFQRKWRIFKIFFTKLIDMINRSSCFIIIRNG